MAFLVIHMGLKLFGAAGKNNSQNCEMVKTEQVFTILAVNPEGYNKRTVWTFIYLLSGNNS